MEKHILPILICWGMIFSLNGQDAPPLPATTEKIKLESENTNLWKTLSKISYKKEYDEFLGFKIDKPVFAEAVKSLEGTMVTVRGYIIPVEGFKKNKDFILSAYPYNMCFFCGGAGPETVMEVESNDAVEFTADQIILTGKLKLNVDDINRLMYLLVDARTISE